MLSLGRNILLWSWWQQAGEPLGHLVKVGQEQEGEECAEEVVEFGTGVHGVKGFVIKINVELLVFCAIFSFSDLSFHVFDHGPHVLFKDVSDEGLAEDDVFTEELKQELCNGAAH